jgi:crossover junction endodeoxyribonuclease RuvC
MRIIGIDPGLAIVGFGIIDCSSRNPQPVSYGAITTPATLSMGERLLTIRTHLQSILQTHAPVCCGIERLFFSRNTKTAMAVSQARGVILCTLEEYGIPAFDYTPTQVKQAVLGFGGADKKQVQFMTKELLRLTRVPQPDDVADALAVAICHYHTSSLHYKP